ncbi:Nicotinamidase-related amidase [Halobacillus alkaliphilus]|uniref:Nicotinamidase-related amidase n=1 Tax=Halobacillus alkaliphilus TaxID=396056 RepID=A0A1I2LZ71_9BACI|nr:isochorismatase family cysteine hydrolase [Halobacillus alkaliphilus]SFF82436.1 Nicotinamidase-related amidase [Halobacillus alkaliphilus]
MKQALLVIDYTNDFVAPEGALTCGEPGQKIERSLTKLCKEFLFNDDFTVLAVDLHEENDPYHPETKLFPPHNIRGTEGRRLYGEIHHLYERSQFKPSLYYMDKTRYSAFAGTDLDIKLRERGITDVHLSGVCTDICVLHTAVDAYNLGYNLTIHKDAVASFNQPGHEWALGHFESVLGATIK